MDDQFFSPLDMGNSVESNAEFIPLISDEDEESMNAFELPEELPVLPLKNTVLFPGVILPISVGREKSLQLVKDVYAGDRFLGAVAQKDTDTDDPGFDDLYQTGTVAQIIKLLEMPDGSTSIIIQGKKRFNIVEPLQEEPYGRARIEPVGELGKPDDQQEFDAIVGSLRDIALKIIKISANLPQEASFAIKNIESTVFLVNFISSNTDISVQEKQKLLQVDGLKERATMLLELLSRELQMTELKNDIQSKVKKDIDQQQREFLLQQQMKTIQNELGGSSVDEDIEELKKKGKEKKWSDKVAQAFDKELGKLQRMNSATAEFSLQLNYLQTLLDIPWNEYTEDNFDLKHAQKVLDDDHFGLEKVKERILEYLAVLKLKKDLKSPILCLYGPPGVGKTSLGKSVAKALGRNYVRMSLGGVHDEAEIRGHRKTYIGALPGRVMQNIKKGGSANPVFVLDEIDKIGRSAHGDPASALLEVLDPEQNDHFYDNYLEQEFDLSKVLFVATANNISSIHPALQDRMELIDVNGYIVEEKAEIAKQHLIPKQLLAHGLRKKDAKLPKNVVEYIIDNYTRESGVRELDKTLAKITRNIAKKVAFEEDYQPAIKISDVQTILGAPKYMKDRYQGNEFAGVVTGLAWTAVGGQILFVETSLSRGKGKLTLTGNLGDVMKESASIAMAYLKAHSNYLGIDPDLFDKWDVHIHVPEGAIPKDGPSAGITMLTSLASAFTQRKLRRSIAMTGEITLRGKVIGVGGIKEKILAAKRADIKNVVLSNENKKDVEEINDFYLKGLTIHYVDEVMEVLDLVLLKEKAKPPKRLSQLS